MGQIAEPRPSGVCRPISASSCSWLRRIAAKMELWAGRALPVLLGRPFQPGEIGRDLSANDLTARGEIKHKLLSLVSTLAIPGLVASPARDPGVLGPCGQRRHP